MTAVVDIASRRRTAPTSGDVSIKLIKPATDYVNEILVASDPNKADSDWLRKYRKTNMWRISAGIERIIHAERMGAPFFFGRLYLKKIEYNDYGVPFESNYGLVGCKVVTNNGVAFIVDALQNILEAETMRYHGFGTTNTAENVADSALAAECTTVLNPDSTRGTGTLGEGATGNIFRTVGTVTFDGSATIVEHGVLSQAATGGGVLLDRTVFAGIGVVSTNSLQGTYDFTITAGS